MYNNLVLVVFKHLLAANRDSLLELLGDAAVTMPIIELARSHSGTVPPSLYLYCFNYTSRSTTGEFPLSGGGNEDDLAYVFGAPINEGIDPFESTYSKTDRTVSETVMKYWENFIKTG